MALRAPVALALALALALAAGVAAAQPSPSPSPAPAPAPSDALREANVAATAGDWGRVAALVDPLVAPPVRGALPPSDLAEAYRLSGMAAFHHGRRELAEAHFLAYLKIDLDGRLDPALYPPEVVGFFDEVRTKHQAELRARRPKPRSYWLLNLIPPGGQIQNRERGKAWVIGGLIGAFAIGNVTSYLVLRSWCTPVRGDGGSSVICDDGKDRAGSASTLRAINLVSGVGLIAAYVYGVYDGARHYRRKESIQPFVVGAAGGGVVGIGGAF